MDLLVIEDNDDKFFEIKESIELSLGVEGYSIHRACSLEVAIRKIYEQTYDLIVFDCYLPTNVGCERDVSKELLEAFSASINFGCEAVAITILEESEIEYVEFNQYGVNVLRYDSDKNWSKALQNKLSRLVQKITYDFLIFCALEEERDGYKRADCELGELVPLGELNCQKVSVDNRQGLIIVPPRMGIIPAAITATRAIDLLKPKLVAMSGVCGGIKDKSSILDVIVASVCWQFETGKYTSGTFSREPYQVAISAELDVHLSQFINSPGYVNKNKEGFFFSELQGSKIKYSPFATTSYVVADDEITERVISDHRKVAAIDMEMAAIYEAARQAVVKPKYFGVKTVVDLANVEKNDAFREPGVVMSARFVVDFIRHHMK